MQDIKLRHPIAWTTPRTCSLGQDQPAHRRLSRIYEIMGKPLLPLKNPASMTPQDALKGMINHPRFLERMKACRQNWAGTPWALSRTIPEVCQVPNCGSTRSKRRAGVSQAHAFSSESRLCGGFAAGGSSFKISPPGSKSAQTRDSEPARSEFRCPSCAILLNRCRNSQPDRPRWPASHLVSQSRRG